MSTHHYEPLPWEPHEPLANPPQLCEDCQEEIEDGHGWLSRGEHILCEPCWKARKG